MFVKDSSISKSTIHYYDIGDSLKREEKLNKLKNFQSLDDVPFYTITPNASGDWINQRNDDEFSKLIPLKNESKKGSKVKSVFMLCGNGIGTNRDSWAYNFDRKTLIDSMKKCIETYNTNLEHFNATKRVDFNQRTKNIKKDLYKYLNDDDLITDMTKISWSRTLKNSFLKNKKSSLVDENKLRIALYKPFVKRWIYCDKAWIDTPFKIADFLPDKESENIFINVNQRGGKGLTLISKEMIDNHFIGDNQVYPFYYYDDLGQRHCVISYYALKLFREHYKDDLISEEDIFYYIYALLNHKGYIEKYQHFLSKEAPRISLSKDFKVLLKLGRELAQLHLHYEKGEMYGEILHKNGLFADMQEKDYYRVQEIKKIDDGRSIIYNENISIVNIPLKAYEYQLGGSSAIDLIIDSYKVRIDGKTCIENDPNLYAGGKYIFELLCRVITLSIKSVDLIEEISKLSLED